jgi:hypothetical protein
MNTVFMNPSLYAHILNAIFLLTAFVLFFMNYSQIVKLGAYEKVTLSLLFSGVVGVHGLSHLGLEGVYGYNPMKMIMYNL